LKNSEKNNFLKGVSMSTVDDEESEELNRAAFDHFISLYEDHLNEWLHAGRLNQWVVIDYEKMVFFQNEEDAFAFYNSLSFEGVKLVRKIANVKPTIKRI
jgi:hypothetical protein